jgi:hypothetical protein
VLSRPEHLSLITLNEAMSTFCFRSLDSEQPWYAFLLSSDVSLLLSQCHSVLTLQFMLTFSPRARNNPSPSHDSSSRSQIILPIPSMSCLSNTTIVPFVVSCSALPVLITAVQVEYDTIPFCVTCLVAMGYASSSLSLCTIFFDLPSPSHSLSTGSIPSKTSSSTQVPCV